MLSRMVYKCQMSAAIYKWTATFFGGEGAYKPWRFIQKRQYLTPPTPTWSNVCSNGVSRALVGAYLLCFFWRPSWSSCSISLHPVRLRMHSQDSDDWVSCTMCRSGRQSVMTLNRAAQRRISWPDPSMQPFQHSEEPRVHTTIDDAFDTVLQYMNVTTRQCRRYYRCRTPDQCNLSDIDHIRRFHKPGYSSRPHRNPLQKSEEVHVEVAPGSYAVTAGRWGAQRDHTHIVRVEPGQTVDMMFAV
ncbi:A-kinase-interacting protein 1 [Nematostella vectensis]|uniref:A-kinase-interacting protein 1 n=1 Tax=Nematostella vectensis TaxID=45351 RepID=UPI0020770F92|nr:A-kinase-interacting protein 1 [Nematostella vectensis]